MHDLPTICTPDREKDSVSDLEEPGDHVERNEYVGCGCKSRYCETCGVGRGKALRREVLHAVGLSVAMRQLAFVAAGHEEDDAQVLAERTAWSR
ncbi:MAG: hypothetical protein AAGI53_17920, partial [Planctomycetota bacterium]